VRSQLMVEACRPLTLLPTIRTTWRYHNAMVPMLLPCDGEIAIGLTGSAG
jgi:hypothetical protein